MSRIHDSILGTIGATPIVRINRLAPPGVNLFVKCEAFNPLGSVKDRLALGVIEAAERSGALKPGQTVIEATSGNTGIGLAMVCAAKGYPCVIVMAESFSVERRRILRFLGAQVVLTPAPARGTGMLAKAVELAEEHGWFLCRQFENEANADVHSRTTAPEILESFEGLPLDYWVTGFGTGGTLKGVARVLKEKSPGTRVIVAEPDNSRILSSAIKQQRHPDGTPVDSHPDFQTHPIQGWGPDFVPKLAEDVVDLDLVDGFVPVNSSDAMRLSRALATEEGIFCGISSGAKRGEPCVKRIALLQAFMGADCNYAAVIHDGNAIGLEHRGETMGNDDGSAFAHEIVQRILHQPFALGVERSSGFIQQHYRRILQYRAGNGDTLALPSREPRAAFAKKGGVTVGQGIDESLDACRPGSAFYFGVAGIRPALPNVLHHSVGEYHCFLRNDTDTPAHVFGPRCGHVDAIEKNTAAAHIVETQQQLKHGCLSRT